MTFKFKRRRQGIPILLPTFPAVQKEVDNEQLTGVVNGMQASAGEERLANALSKANIPFLFRYAVGAPRNMPGWKELDFVVMSGGMIHPIEVDTAFTHREKHQTDILHDAIIENDSQLHYMGQVFPQVRHVDGDSDLANSKNATEFVKKTFGVGNGSESEQQIVGSAQQGTKQTSVVPKIQPTAYQKEDSKKKKPSRIPVTITKKPIFKKQIYRSKDE
jgi:hypothetical protein